MSADELIGRAKEWIDTPEWDAASKRSREEWQRCMSKASALALVSIAESLAEISENVAR
jgi:hypothetical protein